MKFSKNLIIIGAICFIAGCEGVGIPTVSDPLAKLAWAEELYNKQDRPLPAERLILKAINICENKNDKICLAKSYIQYGFFFRSPSVARHSGTYELSGFLNKTVTYKNRYLASLEYFKKATKLLKNTNDYGLLTNAYLNLGFAYGILKKVKLECKSYDKSLVYNTKNMRQNPDTKISLPKGVASYREYVKNHKKRAGCK